MPEHCDSLRTERDPLNTYGSLEPMIRGLRAHRPLDLNAEVWREAHPGGTHAEWRAEARACLLEGLHYDGGAADLRAETLSTTERDGLVVEHVAFNTTPWIRVKGCFLRPADATEPVPGLVAFHAWGGPILFGKERIVNTGRDHPLLVEHRENTYGGRYLAEEFARAGYAVVVIDAHHFGERAPRGIAGIPEDLDPFEQTIKYCVHYDSIVRQQLYLGVRQLNWAGTTWMGVNYWDDMRCIDYLQQRPEVASDRIGCTGVSGGGWRTNVLAALDDRIGASVSICWMTTGDFQQVHNVSGAVGTFCLLPGVWNRMDVPDLAVLAAPRAAMVVSNSQDNMFPPEGQRDAARQIAEGFAWAGCPRHFEHVHLPKPHCYDVELQERAIGWFDNHLA